MGKPRVSEAAQILQDIPVQIDNFQPMAVIQFLREARDQVRQIETDGTQDSSPWNDDMKRGALLALALVQVKVQDMAANRYKGE